MGRAAQSLTFDYEHAASAYDTHRRSGGPFLRPIVDHARDLNARTVVEIGCGTASNTRAFLESHPCSLIGLDASRGMLERARAKSVAARFVRGNGAQLPFATASVDYVFGFMVLQHVTHIEALFAECARVVRRGGVAFATASHDFIRAHPLNTYFPSFESIDLARFPSNERLRVALESVGFTKVSFTILRRAPERIDAAYVQKVADKFISTYALIPAEEFARGLARLHSDLQRDGALATPMEWECLIVTAERP